MLLSTASNVSPLYILRIGSSSLILRFLATSCFLIACRNGLDRFFVAIRDHARFAALDLMYIAPFGHVYQASPLGARRAVVGGYLGGPGNRRRRHRPPATLDDHVRAGNPVCVQPQIFRFAFA